jgi:DNA helicase HerA-like ATPase
MPEEDFKKGDYVKIEDEKDGKSLIVQVYDDSYLDSMGIQEEMLRDELFATTELVTSDPLKLNSISYMIKDAKVLKCKIRCVVDRGAAHPDMGWLPSRSMSRITKLPLDELYSLMGRRGGRPIGLGRTLSGEEFAINAEDMDGRLSIITGRKEAGKSHIAKLLATGLLDYGAYLLIFDLNNEYGGLSFARDGSASGYASKVKVLQPGHSLKFTIRYLGRRIMLDIFQNVLDVPGATLREFLRVWDHLESTGRITLKDMEEVIQHWHCNELVRDALISRYYSLLSSGIFTDSERYEVRLEDLYAAQPDGGAVIVSLAGVNPLARRMIVEALLAKVVETLEQRTIPPLFLFAEEAHLYLRQTYWEDLITRMRHYGVFTVFITNQPDALGIGVYRQADNVFLYNFTNDRDLETVAQASMTDAETVKSIVRSLPPRHCLMLGRTVGDLPVVLKVRDASFQTLGFTRLFFPLKEVAERKVQKP